MKTKGKALLLSLCAILLIAASVLGTIAYLTSSDVAVNTFTVGSVSISLDETDTDGNGDTKANAYKLIPGHSYVKDPTVTVKKGSEDCFVRMMVTVNYSGELDAIFANLYPTADANETGLLSIFSGYNDQKWILHDVVEDTTDNTRTYEFRYQGNKDNKAFAAVTQDTKLEPLFTELIVPQEITKEQLATLVTKDDTTGEITDQFKITIEAHAIQADGFDSAQAAWDQFKK